MAKKLLTAVALTALTITPPPAVAEELAPQEVVEQTVEAAASEGEQRVAPVYPGKVTLEKNQLTWGETIVINGEGFKPNTVVRIQFLAGIVGFDLCPSGGCQGAGGAAGGYQQRVTTDATGNFRLLIPTDASVTEHSINLLAVDYPKGEGSFSEGEIAAASVYFEMYAGPQAPHAFPEIFTEQTPVGQKLNVRIIGMTPNKTIWFNAGGRNLDPSVPFAFAEAVANDQGVAEATLDVSMYPAGTYSVVAGEIWEEATTGNNGPLRRAEGRFTLTEATTNPTPAVTPVAPIMVGQGTVVTGGGFKPGATVMVTVPGTSISVTGTADGNGNISVPLPTEGLVAGEFTINITDGTNTLTTGLVVTSETTNPNPGPNPEPEIVDPGVTTPGVVTPGTNNGGTTITNNGDGNIIAPGGVTIDGNWSATVNEINGDNNVLSTITQAGTGLNTSILNGNGNVVEQGGKWTETVGNVNAGNGSEGTSVVELVTTQGGSTQDAASGVTHSAHDGTSPVKGQKNAADGTQTTPSNTAASAHGTVTQTTSGTGTVSNAGQFWATGALALMTISATSVVVARRRQA